MNKFLLGVSIVSVGAVALGAGSLAITDGQINKMVEQLESSVSAPMSVEVRKDTNSLFARQLDLVVAIQEEGFEATFFIENDIQKRPWGTAIAHAISMQSPFKESNDSLALLFNQSFVDQAFITGTTNVSIGGQYQTVLDSIGINEQTADGALDVKPMHVEMTGDMSGSIAMEGQWPGMVIGTNDLEKVTMELSPMEFSAKGKMYLDSVFLGKQRIAGQGVTLSQASDWQTMAVTFGAFAIESEGRLIDEKFMGRANVDLASLQYTAEDESLQANSIQAAVSIDGISAENYKALAVSLNEFQSSGVPSEQLMRDANVLLRNGFVVEFSDWQAVIEDQSIAFNAMLELPENTVADVNNPFSLMGLFTSIKANANLQFDRGLSDIPQLYDAVFGLLSSGAVVNEGDDYRMAFSLENGVATLNGAPVPLPF